MTILATAKVLGDAAPAADPRFRRNVARVSNRAQTLIAAAFARMSAPKAVKALQRADAALTIVNDMAGFRPVRICAASRSTR